MLLIGSFLITFLTGILSIWQIRGYLRTGLKSYLYLGMMFLVALVLFVVMTVEEMSYDCFGKYLGEYTFLLIMGALIVTAYYFRTSAASTMFYDERVAQEEMYARNTYWQRLTGNVPIVEHQRPRPIPISRRSGLILGLFFTTLGTIVTIQVALLKGPIVAGSILTAAVFSSILGLLLIIFSIACLERGRRSPQ